MKGKIPFFSKSIAFFLIIVLVAATSIVVLYFQIRTDEISALLAEEKNIALHFLVHDGDSLLFSETFLYNSQTGKGALIDIPGNKGTIIASLNRVGGIDTVFNPDKPAPYRALVEDFVGFGIPFYCMFSLDEIERFVDILGGVDVFIANSVENDSMGNKVLLPSGNVSLDGGKARLYIGFTDPEENDVDRIGRIQKFLQAMLKKMGGNAEFLAHAAFEPFLRSSMKTNLEYRAFLTLCREISKLDTDRLILQRVLGTIRAVDSRELLFPHLEGQLFRDSLRQITVNLASDDARAYGEMALSLELLNGTKQDGLARRTREIFQSFGLDVVSFGNATEELEKTRVVDRRGNPEAAARVADIIRCANIVTDIPGPSVTVTADITVILGRDFDGRYCK